MTKFNTISRSIGLNSAMLIITFLFIGCTKDQLAPIITVEGVVFEDCDGNVFNGQQVILQYMITGCFSTHVISEESILTNQDGYYKFEYREATQDGSTNRYYHRLSIPDHSISMYNPGGNMDLYPNDTLMNAVVNLEFNRAFTSSDTFYYKFYPSISSVEAAKKTKYIVGPFQDTTLTLNELRIGNTNNIDNGMYYCGSFKWGISKRNFNTNFTGKDGRFSFTHLPCAESDSFDYLFEIE